ncbi:MAG TPA: hypothetical protein VIY48_17220, partial [Candidatus Paceibacterota bacterium]
MYVTCDFESYSEADLKAVGAWKYWEHPTTLPLMCGFRIADKVFVWVPDRDGWGCPPPVLEAIERGAVFDAHAAGFEQAAWQWLVRNKGWPELPPERWDDTQARCAALSLPLKLERVGPILNLQVQKDTVGKSWIQK